MSSIITLCFITLLTVGDTKEESKLSFLTLMPPIEVIKAIEPVGLFFNINGDIYENINYDYSAPELESIIEEDDYDLALAELKLDTKQGGS